MIKKILACSAFFLLMGFGFANVDNISTVASNINVKKAKVEIAKMGPMGQKVKKSGEISTEVKMDIINSGNQKATLIAATSPVAQKIQLHHFIEQDGKAVMQQINQIVIKARSEDDLSFQGIHIMLMGLKTKLAKGQRIPLTLIFSDGSYLEVTAKAV